MSEKNEEQSAARRRILKRLAAGGGVLATGGLFSQHWLTPVVPSVILPAHAQATMIVNTIPAPNIFVNVAMSPQISTFGNRA